MASHTSPSLVAGLYGKSGIRRLRHLAADSVARTIAAGIEPYDRGRHLPRLIPVTAAEVEDDTIERHRVIIARLARALRAERNRGRAGHWTYDLNRHIGLKQAFAAEKQRLGVRSAASKRHPPPKGGG